MYLNRLVSKVTIDHRSEELHAQKILQDRAFNNDKVEFMWNTVAEKINGPDGKVSSILFKNVETGEEFEKPIDVAFIYIGMVPLSDPFMSLAITNEERYIPRNDIMVIRIHVIYATVHIREKTIRQF